MKIAVMGKIHIDGLEILKKANLKYFEIYNFEESNLKKELKDVDAIILRTANLNSSVLSCCKNLKIVSRHGVGYDNVDLEYLNQEQIGLGITSTSNAVSVAEHVMTMLLYLSRKINLSDQLTRNGNFKQKNTLPDFYELYEKNILIFGFGRIGKALAKRCMAFETNVYVCDPFVDDKIIKENGCYPINKLEGLKIADCISIHLPLNEKTKNFISYDDFKITKPNLILINTSRGEIINEEALYDVLNQNKISGAGLDVYNNEPPLKDNPLFSLSNTVLTPHNSALTLGCRKRMAIETFENILYYLTGDQLLNKKNIINNKIIGMN